MAKKKIGLKLPTTTALQTTLMGIVAFVASLKDLAEPLDAFLPPKLKAGIVAAAGVAVIALHQHAGKTNPDGTSAAEPYEGGK